MIRSLRNPTCLACAAIVLAIAGCSGGETGDPGTGVAVEAETEREEGRLLVRADRDTLTTVERLNVRVIAHAPPSMTPGRVVFDAESAGWTEIQRSQPERGLDDRGRTTSTLEIVLEPFLDGPYEIPSASVSFQSIGPGREPLALTTQPIPVSVTSVLDAQEPELTLAPVAGPVGPPELERAVPGWLLLLLGAAAIAVLLVARAMTRAGPNGPATRSPEDRIRELDAARTRLGASEIRDRLGAALRDLERLRPSPEVRALIARVDAGRFGRPGAPKRDAPIVDLDAALALIGGRMIDHLAWPWALALLLVLPAVVIRPALGRLHASVNYPSAARAGAAARSWRTMIAWGPAAIRVLVLVSLVIVLARPQSINHETETTVNGIAMQIVVDRSGSMDERTQFDGEPLNRLEAVKRVVSEFIRGNGDDLPGRDGDLIGLIAFGTFADTVCPLVREYEPLLEILDQIRIPLLESEQGTSIGDALALAAARLKSAEDELAQGARLREGFKIKGKAIVLLTDGEDRNSQISTRTAAEWAAEWGVRVYIIGIRGGASQIIGGQRVYIGQEVNERQLADAAEHTGGAFWPVSNVEDLRDVYAEIDRLEKTEIEVDEFAEREERFAWFAAPALGLIWLELLLRLTVLRRWP